MFQPPDTAQNSPYFLFSANLEEPSLLPETSKRYLESKSYANLENIRLI
jgi:hypothetical protein